MNFDLLEKAKVPILAQAFLLLFFQVFLDFSFASPGEAGDSVTENYLLVEQSLADSPMSKLANEDVLQYLNRVQKPSPPAAASQLQELRDTLSQGSNTATVECGPGEDPKGYLERLEERLDDLIGGAILVAEDVARGRITPTAGIAIINRLLRDLGELVDFWCSNCFAIKMLNIGYRGILRAAQSILEIGPVEPDVLRAFVRIVADIARSFTLCEGVITTPIRDGFVV